MLKKTLFIFIFIFAILYPQSIIVMPFQVTNQALEEKFAVLDGVPRLFAEALISTKLFANVEDYDLVVAYFGAEDTLTPYQMLSSNESVAVDFVNEVFEANYIIMGNILDFSSIDLETNEVASVSFEAKIISLENTNDIKTIYNTSTFTMKKFSSTNTIKVSDAAFLETALGKATEKALKTMAYEVYSLIGTPASTALITRVEKNNYYIDLGSSHGIKIGDSFDIFSQERLISTNLISTNNINTKTGIHYEGYVPIRTNELGEIWFTSERLYKYRLYDYASEFVLKAKVVELYETYAVLEKSDAKSIGIVLPLMLAKLVMDDDKATNN